MVAVVTVELCEPRPFTTCFLGLLLFLLLGSMHQRRRTETFAALALAVLAFTVVVVGVLPTRLPRCMERLPCVRLGSHRGGV